MAEKNNSEKVSSNRTGVSLYSLRKGRFSTNGKWSTPITGVTLAQPHSYAHTRKYVSALITLEGLK